MQLLMDFGVHTSIMNFVCHYRTKAKKYAGVHFLVSKCHTSLVTHSPLIIIVHLKENLPYSWVINLRSNLYRGIWRVAVVCIKLHSARPENYFTLLLFNVFKRKKNMVVTFFFISVTYRSIIKFVGCYYKCRISNQTTLKRLALFQYWPMGDERSMSERDQPWVTDDDVNTI